ITQDRNGRAHAWNAVNHNGKITYVDAQTGQRSNKPLHDGTNGVHAIPLNPNRRPMQDTSTDNDHSNDADRRPSAEPAGSGDGKRHGQSPEDIHSEDGSLKRPSHIEHQPDRRSYSGRHSNSRAHETNENARPGDAPRKPNTASQDAPTRDTDSPRREVPTESQHARQSGEHATPEPSAPSPHRETSNREISPERKAHPTEKVSTAHCSTELARSLADANSRLRYRTSGDEHAERESPDGATRRRASDRDPEGSPATDDTKKRKGLLGRVWGSFSSKPSEPQPDFEITVDQIDYQIPFKHPDFLPSGYATPLDRPDGTRTPLFDDEPKPEQTEQGAIGDCGIISALGAVARHRPEAIRECVRELEDGNYEVRFHETRMNHRNGCYEPTGRMIVMTVSPELPVFGHEPGEPAYANNKGAAWAPILEKAIAALDQSWDAERNEKYDSLSRLRMPAIDPPHGYARLGLGSRSAERAELLAQLTGEPSSYDDFPAKYDQDGRSPDKQIMDTFREKLSQNSPILVGTEKPDKGSPPWPDGVHGGHAYEIAGIDNRGRLILRNPHNKDHPDPMTLKEFKKYFKHLYSALEPRE
ncbi:toxin glutamine deamidase domain-containing protein, partial [Streptomyces sp. NPDC050636]|uniref:toxin glutamine deamidase domain-containing protein n=1 Tax=Streptomyces sp. NPDC050636 TaxID=3154510 RepID=UPI00341C08EA